MTEIEKLEAGLEYCRAIEIKPENFEAHYNYALLLRSLNFHKEALTELEKAGMLANKEADAAQQKYIFEVLGEVRQKLISKGEGEYLKNRTEESATDNSELAYKDGKVIINEKADKIFRKKLMTCPMKQYFEDL